MSEAPTTLRKTFASTFEDEIVKSVVGPRVSRALAKNPNPTSRNNLRETFLDICASDGRECEVSASTFSNWLDILGIKFSRSVSIVRPVT